MPTTRPVRIITQSQPTLEGAGVRLRRAFGFNEVPDLDPFLLLDDFRGDDPAHYRAGFPWHPHRGIETITYMLDGSVEHGDSLGNRGAIGAGDVQWMTAGSGVIHQEMPQGGPSGRMGGFQLWANLPSGHKMMEPRYREVKCAEIPKAELPGGATAAVICGEAGGEQGPVRDIVTAPEYLDVTVPAGAHFTHPVPPERNAFAYVFAGRGRFGRDRDDWAGDHSLVVFGAGDQVEVAAGDQGVRFLLISGRPIGEPVAWRGPIVMNTQDELRTAFEEYRTGTFLKHPRQ